MADAITVPTVIKLAAILAELTKVEARKVAVVISVANKLPIVAVEILALFKLNVPALKLVATTLVEVKLVENNAAVVTLVVNRAVPDTSSVAPGAVVAIPTLPDVVNIEPIVLVLNDALKPPLVIKMELDVIDVIIAFNPVTLVYTILLITAPPEVNAVLTIFVRVELVPEILSESVKVVTSKLPVVMADAITVPTVIKLAAIFAELTKVEARKVAVVISVTNKLVTVSFVPIALVYIKLDAVTFVSSAFVPVIFVLSKFPTVAVEILALFKLMVPALKFVATRLFIVPIDVYTPPFNANKLPTEEVILPKAYIEPADAEILPFVPNVKIEPAEA